jgi:hypothetical protein
MSKTKQNTSDKEQWSSDGSDEDDGSKSDEEYGNSDNSSKSDGEDYSHDDSDGDSNGSYSEDGDDDDDYDYEKGENPEGFDDEQTSTNPRYVVTERFTDDEDGETKNNDLWWEGREKIIAAVLLCWCCLCLIIIGIVLGVVLGGNSKNRDRDDNGPEILVAPTGRPTFAPQPLPPSLMSPSPTESLEPTIAITLSPTIRPTSRPTISPTASFAPTKTIPETIVRVADQDTYTQYNVSKEYEGEEYGLMDSFLVQKVPLKDEELADSIGLVSFPIEEVPVFSRIQGMEKSAVLRLTHVVSTEERPPANYTIIRIPETRTRMEYWHGFYFIPPEDDDVGVSVGPVFEVDPSDTVIDIDVSSLFFNYTMDQNKKPQKVFFMIENRGPDQVKGGDRFYTRESATPPQLTLNFKTSDTEGEPEVGELIFEDEDPNP